MRRRRLAQLLGLLVVGALVAYVVANRELVDALRAIAPGRIPVLLAIALAGLTALGLQFSSIARVFGTRLSPREWFGLTAVNTMVSYALPARGGLVVRAGYLARVHRMTLPRYGALTAIAMLTTLAVAALIGLVTTLLFLDGTAAVRAIVIFGVALAALTAVATVVPLASLIGSRLKRAAATLEAFRRGLEEIRGSRSELWRFLVWTIVFFLIQGGGLWVAFDVVGSTASLAEVLIVHSAASVSFVIAITPGGLGIKEGVTTFMAGLIGLDADLALLAALVDRAAVAAVVFAAGLALGPGLAARAAEAGAAG